MATQKNIQIERDPHDLRRNEVEILQSAPYEYQRAFYDPVERRIARRLKREGFLETDPSTKGVHTRFRCTQRGTDAVRHFERLGWLERR